MHSCQLSTTLLLCSCIKQSILKKLVLRLEKDCHMWEMKIQSQYPQLQIFQLGQRLPYTVAEGFIYILY